MSHVSPTSACLKVFLWPCILCLPLERRIPTLAASTLAKNNKRSVGLVSCVSDRRFFESVSSALSPVTPLGTTHHKPKMAASTLAKNNKRSVGLVSCVSDKRFFESVPSALSPVSSLLGTTHPNIGRFSASQDQKRSISLVSWCQDTE